MKHFPELRSHLKRAASVMSIVALSVVTTLLVQHFSAPTPVAAQAGAQREVRAQLFLLVGPSGNTLARLGPGGLGNGNLELRDTSGTIRADFAGDAVAHLWDANSNLLWQAP